MFDGLVHERGKAVVAVARAMETAARANRRIRLVDGRLVAILSWRPDLTGVMLRCCGKVTLRKSVALEHK